MDDDEFKAFFTMMHPRLLRYGMRQLDADTAGDAASDALRVVWSKHVASPQSEDEQRQLASLTYTIMNGVISNILRAERRRFRLVDALKSEQHAAPQVEPDLADQFIDGHVPEAIRTLPAADQEVLSLLIDGYGVNEIAEFLGTSPGAISMRLSRARTRLRTLLEHPDD